MPNEPLSIKSVVIGTQTVHILSFSGELAAPQMDNLADQVDRYLTTLTSPYSLIVDLTEVVYMSSKGVGYITSWHMRAAETGGTVVMCGAQQNVKTVLDTLGITDIIPYYQTYDLAIAHFQNPGQP